MLSLWEKHSTQDIEFNQNRPAPDLLQEGPQIVGQKISSIQCFLTPFENSQLCLLVNGSEQCEFIVNIVVHCRIIHTTVVKLR